MLLRIILLFLLSNSGVIAAGLNPQEKSIDDVKIYYAYDDFLPIISMNIAITNSGIAYSDDDLVGINSVVSYLANNFLFLADKRDDFTSEISARNISVSFKSGMENFYISLKFMPSDIKFITEFLQHFFYKFEVLDDDLIKAKEFLSYKRNNSYLNSNFISYQNFSTNFFDKRYSRDAFINDQSATKITGSEVGRFVKNLANKKQLRIAIAGDLQESNLAGFIGDIFSPFSNDANIPHYKSGLVTSSDKEFELEGYDQIIFYSGIIGPARNSKDFYSFYVFNHLIGGSQRNSFIGNRLREESALTYSGYSYVNYYSNLGYLIVHFACDKTKYEQASFVIKTLLQDIKTKEFTEAELVLAKQYLMGKYDIAFSSNSSISAFMLGLLLNDLPITMLKERNEFVSDINLDDINQIRDKLFLENDFITTVTGDLS